MTDKQLEIILLLLANKIDACETIEEVKRAVEDIRKMAKNEN